MYFLNTYEIDELWDWTRRYRPQALPFATFLRDWRDIVDENSDGWPYWAGGSRPAEKLMRALVAIHREGAVVDEAALRKTLAPIKACCTRRKLPAPTLHD